MAWGNDVGHTWDMIYHIFFIVSSQKRKIEDTISPVYVCIYIFIYIYMIYICLFVLAASIVESRIGVVNTLRMALYGAFKHYV